MFVFIAGNAVRQYRRQRALGVTMQWGKLFTTLAGCMIIALIGRGGAACSGPCCCAARIDRVAGISSDPQPPPLRTDTWALDALPV